MKATTTKQKLQHAVSLVERVVGKKESLPVLSCILFTITKDISLRTTNLEAGIEVVIPGEVQEKGVVAVSAAVFSQTIRSIGGESISLTLDDGNLTVQSKGTKTLIKAVPHDEFPEFSDADGVKTRNISRELFLHAIQAVSYAASPSMIRPDLGSVYVRVGDGALTTVATDSFRLAEKKIVDSKLKDEFDVLIPLKHALELAHILERMEDDEIQFAADESQLVVRGSGAQYISRVVDATFPNYKEIIPKTFTTEATVLKNDLTDMLRKARVFSGNDQHVGFHIYPKKKVFSATARSNDVGEMSDSIDAAISGEDLDINFHIGYIAECLTSIESDSVTLGFAGTGRPLVVRGVSDQTFTYLVMPLNR